MRSWLIIFNLTASIGLASSLVSLTVTLTVTLCQWVWLSHSQTQSTFCVWLSLTLWIRVWVWHSDMTESETVSRWELSLNLSMRLSDSESETANLQWTETSQSVTESLRLWDWVSEWVSDDKRTRTETQIEIQNSEQWWVSEWRVELENLLVLRLPNLIV